MEDRIRIFLNNYINGLYFPTVHLTDVIEILIITVIVYEIMLWIKNTKAWMLLKGMIMLGAFFLLAAIFKMHTILFVAKVVGAALIIRVASTDHKPAAADDVAVTEVDTEVVVSDEMIDVAVDRAMLDDYSLYVYLSDASVE